MNIYIDFILFALIILVYWIITELFTIFFRFTGLPAERARFQVISLLTGTGFTTRESELLLTTKRRRHLARVTMLFGYVFNITIVSAFINVFLTLKMKEMEHYYVGILIFLSVLLLLVVLMRRPKIHAWSDNLLQRLANRMVGHAAGTNTVMLLNHIGVDSIAVVKLSRIPEAFQNVALRDTGLKRNNGILVLLIEHEGAKAVPAGADTVFSPGDKLTLFGDYSTICKVFHASELFADE